MHFPVKKYRFPVSGFLVFLLEGGRYSDVIRSTLTLTLSRVRERSAYATPNCLANVVR